MKVNGRGGNLTPCHPKTHQPMVTKICVCNCVGDIYHRAKFCLNRFRGFGFAHACVISRPSAKSDSVTFFGSWERLQPRRVHRFWRRIRQTTRFRARKCLLGLQNQTLRFQPSFSQKTPFLGPDGTWNFFAQNGFNIGRLQRKRPLIVVIAQ